MGSNSRQLGSDLLQAEAWGFGSGGEGPTRVLSLYSPTLCVLRNLRAPLCMCYHTWSLVDEAVVNCVSSVTCVLGRRRRSPTLTLAQPSLPSMAGLAPEGTQFDAKQFDAKMAEL